MTKHAHKLRFLSLETKQLIRRAFLNQKIWTCHVPRTLLMTMESKTKQRLLNIDVKYEKQP